MGVQVIGALLGPIIGALLTPTPPPPPEPEVPATPQPLPEDETGADVVLGSQENKVDLGGKAGSTKNSGKTVLGSSAGSNILGGSNPTLQGSKTKSGSTLGNVGGGGLNL